MNLVIPARARLYEQRIILPRWFPISVDSGQRASLAMRNDVMGRRFWAFVSTVPLTILTLFNAIIAWSMDVRGDARMVARYRWDHVGGMGWNIRLLHSNGSQAHTG